MKNTKTYGGKVVHAQDFADVWNEFILGHISKRKAYKELGVTEPTFTKWGNEVIRAQFDLSKCYFIAENYESLKGLTLVKKKGK